MDSIIASGRRNNKSGCIVSCPRACVLISSIVLLYVYPFIGICISKGLNNIIKASSVV